MGVIPWDNLDLNNGVSIPYVCGGDPNQYKVPTGNWPVFPTYVGVILNMEEASRVKIGIPHVCGGDPTIDAAQTNETAYSPRMWG